MRFGSVCSGIEAASVAFTPLGWEAAWFSEIEAFPCAVLKHHYPDVPNHGDMTLIGSRILAGEIEAPDLLCGGTPCQAFSTAGKRASLQDARGNLSLSFVELANDIDDVRVARGEPPCIVLWENVPGVLSTEDNAFGCFLAGLAGEPEPLLPSGGRWTNAGAVLGRRRMVVWRILDAQYFGLAQRRRRVFVISSARKDFDPIEVLLVEKGMRRNPTKGSKTGEETTPSVGEGPDESMRSDLDAWAFMTGNSEKTRSMGEAVELTPTLCSGGIGCGIATACIDPLNPEIVGTINTQSGSGNIQVNGNHLILEVEEDEDDLCIPCRSSGHEGAMGGGIGKSSDPSFTLDTSSSMAVAYTEPIFEQMCVSIAPGPCSTAEGKEDIFVSEIEISRTIDCQGANPAHTQGGIAIITSEQIPDALDLISDDTDDQYIPEVSPVLTAKMQGSSGWAPVNETAHLVTSGPKMTIRRLTPLECARLQGFPDDYLDIMYQGKPATDGNKYHAIGNSWAVPCVRWIGQKIDDEDKKRTRP